MPALHARNENGFRRGLAPFSVMGQGLGRGREPDTTSLGRRCCRCANSVHGTITSGDQTPSQMVDEVTWGPGLLGAVGVGGTLNFVVNSSRGGHEREDQRSVGPSHSLLPSLPPLPISTEPPFLTRDPFRDTRNMSERAARRDRRRGRRKWNRGQMTDKPIGRPRRRRRPKRTDRD